MQKIIKFAVIGCGVIGKRHAEMIRRNPEASLVALIDIDTNLKSFIEQQYKVPLFNSIEELVDSKMDVDVVNICTPNGLHASHSLTCLKNNFNVVCEKPMALKKNDAEKMIYQSLQDSKLLFCVMQNRYSPPSVWLKSVINQKLLGNIYLVQINCFWNRDERYYKPGSWKGTEQMDGGTLFTQFSHFIDIMYWLFGDINNIHAEFNDFNHQHLTDFEDSGIITFNFVNGGMGNLNYSTSVWNSNLESSMTIIGEKGSVKVSGQYMDQVTYCNIKDYKMPVLKLSNPPNDYGEYKGSAANHHYIIENVVDTILGRSTITTNALEGLKVVDIIERIYSLR